MIELQQRPNTCPIFIEGRLDSMQQMSTCVKKEALTNNMEQNMEQSGENRGVAEMSPTGAKVDTADTQPQAQTMAGVISPATRPPSQVPVGEHRKPASQAYTTRQL